MQLRRLTALAMYTTLSLAIYAAEALLPPLVPIPGMKLGLSNIISLLLLRHYPLRDAVLVLLARILLASLLFGQLLSLLYSLCGGFAALLGMWLLTRLFNKRFASLTGAVGGLLHNLFQLCVACLLTATPGVFAYLPFLMLGGILTGVFTGLCAVFSDKYLYPRFPKP